MKKLSLRRKSWKVGLHVGRGVTYTVYPKNKISHDSIWSEKNSSFGVPMWVEESTYQIYTTHYKTDLSRSHLNSIVCQVENRDNFILHLAPVYSFEHMTTPWRMTHLTFTEWVRATFEAGENHLEFPHSWILQFHSQRQTPLWSPRTHVRGSPCKVPRCNQQTHVLILSTTSKCTRLCLGYNRAPCPLPMGVG